MWRIKMWLNILLYQFSRIYTGDTKRSWFTGQTPVTVCDVEIRYQTALNIFQIGSTRQNVIQSPWQKDTELEAINLWVKFEIAPLRRHTEISGYLLFDAFLNAADRNPLFRSATRRVIVKTLVSRRKFRRATRNVYSIMKSHGNENEERGRERDRHFNVKFVQSVRFSAFCYAARRKKRKIRADIWRAKRLLNN